MAKLNRSKQNKANLERKIAAAEALKVSSHEDELKTALREHLQQIIGHNSADKLLDRLWRLRIHKLWEESYRINMWIEEDEYNRYIKYSFFAKYNTLRGFYYTNPSFSEVLGLGDEKKQEKVVSDDKIMVAKKINEQIKRRKEC